MTTPALRHTLTGALMGGGLALTMLLAACAEQAPVTRAPTEPRASHGASFSPDPGPPIDAVTADPELRRQREAAGIPDCPPGDPDIAPQASGLPDLVLPCLGGGTPVRLAGLRGAPMVVNIWAQWCGPCRQEAPYLAEVSQELTGSVRFLGVDFSDPQPDRAIAFAGEAGWGYPHVVDDDKQIQAPLGMVGPPMTVFVDADGVVVARHPGVVTSSDQLRELIRQHLGVG